MLVAPLVACGDSSDSTTTIDTTQSTTTSTSAPRPSTTTTTVPTPPTTAGPDGTTSSTQATTTSEGEPSTSTTTEAGTTSTTVASEVVDFGPREGDVLAVVGVDHDDVLNVRSGPFHTYDIVATLDPLETDVVAGGETRIAGDPPSFWYYVITPGGADGWVSAAYVGYIGFGEDATAQVVADAGELPIAETLTDLGVLVANTLVPLSPPPDVVVVAAPQVGDVNSITVDVIGLQDDAQLGVRLEITATEHESGETFVLETVNAVSLCSRGVDPGTGFCV